MAAPATPADGFSIYFGNDIDSSANFGEEGPGTAEAPATGVTVAFDIYDNGGLEAPAIDLKLGGVTQSHNLLDIFGIISDTYTDVKVTLGTTAC